MCSLQNLLHQGFASLTRTFFPSSCLVPLFRNHCSSDAQTPQCMDVPTSFLSFLFRQISQPMVPTRPSFSADWFPFPYLYFRYQLHPLSPKTLISDYVFSVFQIHPFPLNRSPSSLKKAQISLLKMKIQWPQPKQHLRPCPLPATQSLPFSLLCNWLHLFPWLPCFVLSRSSHLSTTLLLLKLAVTLMSLYSGDSFQSIVLSVGFNTADHSPHLKPSLLLASKTPHVLSLSLSGFSSLASLRGLSFSISHCTLKLLGAVSPIPSSLPSWWQQ